jgi:hypothetical protein
MLDSDAFQRAFTTAMQEGHAERYQAKAEEKTAALGLAMPAIDLGGLTANFCTEWPKIKGFVNMALGMAGWFYPKEAAAVKAFMAAAESTLVPAVCGTAAAKK